MEITSKDVANLSDICYFKFARKRNKDEQIDTLLKFIVLSPTNSANAVRGTKRGLINRDQRLMLLRSALTSRDGAKLLNEEYAFKCTEKEMKLLIIELTTNYGDLACKVKQYMDKRYKDFDKKLKRLHLPQDVEEKFKAASLMGELY